MKQIYRFPFKNVSYLEKLKKFKLIYRGSKDGFRAIDFHSKCDYMGPTFIII